MPKTRSARNSVNERYQSSPSNENESQSDTNSQNKSLPTSDKCLSCKEEFEIGLPNGGLDIAVCCPCMLSVCQSCADKSKENEEYCPSDKHLDGKDFIEKEIDLDSLVSPENVTKKLENVTQEELAVMDKIAFIFNNKYLIYHRKPRSVEEFSKKFESQSMVSCDQLQTMESRLRTLECNSNVVNNITNNVVNNITIFNIYCSGDIPVQKVSSKTSFLNFSRSLVIVAVAAAAVGILIGFYGPLVWSMYGHLVIGKPSTGPIINESFMIEKVFDQFKTLESTYTKQSQDLWGTLRRGMRNLVKKSKEPMTILLLHSENSTIDTCFLRDIKKIANKAVEYQMLLNEESNGAETTDTNAVATKTKPKGVIIDMETNSDIFDNPGVFMEKYKAQLEQEKLMIVVNFHKSPQIVMEAFHFLTDSYDPYIENILIILTVGVKDKNYDVEEHVETIAEHELADLLQSLPGHKSEPLITRLTENVYIVKTEESDMISMSCSLY